MNIDKGIEMLELEMNFMGHREKIYPILLWDDTEAILVDAGIIGQAESIKALIESMGIPFGKLSKIIVTHHDLDHIGGLRSLVEETGNRVQVFAHELEKPYIQAEKPPLKMTPARIEEMKQSMVNLNDEERGKMKLMLESKGTSVDETIEDGQELPFCGGIIVIHVPGHVPGHTCLYHKTSKTLICGDALNIADGKLEGPSRMRSYDPDLAYKSLSKLLKFDIKNVASYHGGLFNLNVNQRIRELIT